MQHPQRVVRFASASAATASPAPPARSSSSSSSPSRAVSSILKTANGAAPSTSKSPATPCVKANAASTPADRKRSCESTAKTAPSTPAKKKVAAWLEKSAWEKWIRSEFPESKLTIRCMSLVPKPERLCEGKVQRRDGDGRDNRGLHGAGPGR